MMKLRKTTCFFLGHQLRYWRQGGKLKTSCHRCGDAYSWRLVDVFREVKQFLLRLRNSFNKGNSDYPF